jgi:hypothetical protein
MAEWRDEIRLKHLLTNVTTHAAVQASMSAIADAIDASPAFVGFPTAKFRAIPLGDDTFGPSDYAKRYLDELYDFADARRIWIE